MDACRGRHHIDCVILLPDGRVSEVQRRQMTTVVESNCHAVAVTGTFDDCQDLVKAAFADAAFRTDVSLSAVNSINWARVMAQIVYYVTAHLALARHDDDLVSFCVPTGNFGNILAGWAAKRMGLPVERLIVASNRNDILTRFFTTGTMAIADVVPSTSPSMDIQVSSNLERLLFEVLDRDGEALAEMMRSFRADGTVSVPTDVLTHLQLDFDAGRLDDEQGGAVIRSVHERIGMILDPHTAVGVGVAEAMGTTPGVPMVCLGTAHPAKFPDAVEAAIGIRPPLPPHLADLLERPERIEHVSNDLGEVQTLVRRAVATS
jgi:threonine synthase